MRKIGDKIIIAFSELLKTNGKLRLGIVGSGILKNTLEELVNEIDIKNNVEFYGFQSNVIPYLHRSKIFIMASKMEGLPVALMEAMACEKTVIAPNVDNIPTVLQNGITGYLMHNTTQSTINATLSKAYNNYLEDSKLRIKARQMIIDNYSYESAVSKWEKVFLEINAEYE